MDSADKRASAIGAPLPTVFVAFTPDGTISGAGDRSHLAFLYRGVAALAVAPVLQTSVISSDGNSITLTFDINVSFGAGGNGGFTITMSRGAAALTYSSGAGSTQLVYSIARTIDASETGTLAYVQPGNGVEGSGGDDLESFSGFSVSNDSTADAIPPILQSGSINTDTDEITFLFNENVSFGAGGNGGFTITMSGGGATLTYSSGSGTRELVYSISRAVSDTETGTYAYTQPGNGVEDASGNDLVTFSGATVLFDADLGHNSPSLRHMRVQLRHKDPNDTHNDTTIEHNE